MKSSFSPLPTLPSSHTNLPLSLHPNITITPPNADTLPSYRRLISSLLPIPYPSSFYAASIPPSPDSFALLALWHDPSHPTPIVVAGIQGRVEPACPSPSSLSFFSTTATSSSLPALPQTSPADNEQAQTLYIQTLAVLAPYRTLGIATNLLSALLTLALSHHPNLTSIYAHVWEASHDALDWYVRRGFAVEELIGQYYRRLKPQGARVVRRGLGVGDWLKVEKEITAVGDGK